MDRLSALYLINPSVSIKNEAFKCIAREQRQVKIRSQRSSSFSPSFMSYSALLKLLGNRRLSIYNLITRLPSRAQLLVRRYNTTLSSIIDCHAKIKTKTVKDRPTVPGYNDEIKSAKRLRRKAEYLEETEISV